MPINRKFCDKTSYGDSYNPVAVSPVQPYRCVTEMSNPSGDINFETTTGELVVHKYGRPAIIRPKDNGILCEADESSASRAATRASTSFSDTNYSIPEGKNNHRTGYETMSKSVESTMKWKETRPDMNTTNNLMFPQQKVNRYKKVDRNDFVKYVDFGFDTPTKETVYGGDYKELLTSQSSPVYRKMSTVSLEASSGIQETTTSYEDQFQGKQRSRLPSLTEMDAHLRSSITLN